MAFRAQKGVKRRPRKKCMADGILFDSKEERERYYVLIIMEKKGEIKNLKVHPRFVLQPSFKKYGSTIRQISYTADFEYYRRLDKGDWFKVVEDKKPWNVKRQEFVIEEPARLRHKMFEYQHQDIIFRIVK